MLRRLPSHGQRQNAGLVTVAALDVTIYLSILLLSCLGLEHHAWSASAHEHSLQMLARRRQLLEPAVEISSSLELLNALRNPNVSVIRLAVSSLSLNSVEWMSLARPVELNRSILLIGGGRYGYNSSGIIQLSEGNGPYVILDCAGVVDRLQLTAGGQNSSALSERATLVLQGLWLRSHLPPTGYGPLLLAPSPGAAVIFTDCVLERLIGLQLSATVAEAEALPPLTGLPAPDISITTVSWCSPSPAAGTAAVHTPPAAAPPLTALPATADPTQICFSAVISYFYFTVELTRQCSPRLEADSATDSSFLTAATPSTAVPCPGWSLPAGKPAVTLVSLINCTYGVQLEVNPECVRNFGPDFCIYQQQLQLLAPRPPPAPRTGPAVSGQGVLSPGASAGVAVVATLCSCLALGLFVRFVRRLRDGHRTLTLAVRPPGANPLTTLVVTDIQNSTNLWEQLPTSVMNEALRLHHRCLRALLLKCNGYESATEGDSFILAFHGPVEAARFAILVQSALLKLPWPQELMDHEDGREVWAEPARPKVVSPLTRGAWSPQLQPYHSHHSRSLGFAALVPIGGHGVNAVDDSSDDEVGMGSAPAGGDPLDGSGGRSALLHGWLAAAQSLQTKASPRKTTAARAGGLRHKLSSSSLPDDRPASSGALIPVPVPASTGGDPEVLPDVPPLPPRRDPSCSHEHANLTASSTDLLGLPSPPLLLPGGAGAGSSVQETSFNDLNGGTQTAAAYITAGTLPSPPARIHLTPNCRVPAVGGSSSTPFGSAINSGVLRLLDVSISQEGQQQQLLPDTEAKTEVGAATPSRQHIARGHLAPPDIAMTQLVGINGAFDEMQLKSAGLDGVGLMGALLSSRRFSNRSDSNKAAGMEAAAAAAISSVWGPEGTEPQARSGAVGPSKDSRRGQHNLMWAMNPLSFLPPANGVASAPNHDCSKDDASAAADSDLPIVPANGSQLKSLAVVECLTQLPTHGAPGPLAEGLEDMVDVPAEPYFREDDDLSSFILVSQGDGSPQRILAPPLQPSLLASASVSRAIRNSSFGSSLPLVPSRLGPRLHMLASGLPQRLSSSLDHNVITTMATEAGEGGPTPSIVVNAGNKSDPHGGVLELSAQGDDRCPRAATTEGQPPQQQPIRLSYTRLHRSATLDLSLMSGGGASGARGSLAAQEVPLATTTTTTAAFPRMTERPRSPSQALLLSSPVTLSLKTPDQQSALTERDILHKPSQFPAFTEASVRNPAALAAASAGGDGGDGQRGNGDSVEVVEVSLTRHEDLSMTAVATPSAASDTKSRAHTFHGYQMLQQSSLLPGRQLEASKTSNGMSSMAPSAGRNVHLAPLLAASRLTGSRNLMRMRTQALEVIPLSEKLAEVRQTWRQLCASHWPLVAMPPATTVAHKRSISLDMTALLSSILPPEPMEPMEPHPEAEGDEPELHPQKSQPQYPASKGPRGAVMLFRGCRVRIGIHSGIPLTTDVSFNHTTGHMAYSGMPLKVAKAIGDCAAGGSVLISNSSFNLLHPHLADMPEHLEAHFCGDAQIELVIRSLYMLMNREQMPRLGYLAPLRNLRFLQTGNLDAPVGTAAICFMTVAGATKAVAELGQPAVSALQLFKSIVTRECCDCSGFVVEATDGLCLAAFMEPAAAAIWALRCKEALGAHPWPPEILASPHFREVRRDAPSPQVQPQSSRGGRTGRSGLPSRRGVGVFISRGPRIRTGIAVGAVTAEVSTATARLTYRGKVMNRSARVAAQAADNQILLSEAAWRRLVATAGVCSYLATEGAQSQPHPQAIAADASSSQVPFKTMHSARPIPSPASGSVFITPGGLPSPTHRISPALSRGPDNNDAFSTALSPCVSPVPSVGRMPSNTYFASTTAAAANSSITDGGGGGNQLLAAASQLLYGMASDGDTEDMEQLVSEAASACRSLPSLPEGFWLTGRSAGRVTLKGVADAQELFDVSMEAQLPAQSKVAAAPAATPTSTGRLAVATLGTPSLSSGSPTGIPMSAPVPVGRAGTGPQLRPQQSYGGQILGSGEGPTSRAPTLSPGSMIPHRPQYWISGEGQSAVDASPAPAQQLSSACSRTHELSPSARTGAVVVAGGILQGPGSCTRAIDAFGERHEACTCNTPRSPGMKAGGGFDAVREQQGQEGHGGLKEQKQRVQQQQEATGGKLKEASSCGERVVGLEVERNHEGRAGPSASKRVLTGDALLEALVCAVLNEGEGGDGGGGNDGGDRGSDGGSVSDGIYAAGGAGTVNEGAEDGGVV